MKSVAHVFSFFVLFGSFIKIQLNLDLFVQPALFLLLKFSNGRVRSAKLFFLHLMTFGVKINNIPCVSSWILNNFPRVVDVIKQLNLSRLEVHKTSPFLLQSFNFWTLYTKIDLQDLKACMKVLIN
jgi:hypothetical protein